MAGLQNASGVERFPSPDQKARMPGLPMPCIATFTMPLSGSIWAGAVKLRIRSEGEGVLNMPQLKAKKKPGCNAPGSLKHAMQSD